MSQNKKKQFQDFNDKICPSSSQEEYSAQQSHAQRRFARKRWTLDDNLRYTSFLSRNLGTFLSETLRKRDKIFKKLARHMGNKNMNQTKSHHQKMMIKYQKEQAIIDHFTKLSQSKMKQKVKIQGNKALKSLKELRNVSLQCMLLDEGITVREDQCHTSGLLFSKTWIIKSDDDDENDWFEDV